MRLYLLTSNHSVDYDEYQGFVIAASDLTEARGLADQGAVRNQKGDFLDKDSTTCRFLGDAGYGIERGILSSDFNAG